MAGVHRAYHVYDLAAAHLADYYPVRTHPEARFYELSHIYASAPLDVGITSFHTHYVFYVAQLKLAGIFYNYDAFACRYKIRQRIQKRSLSGTRTP